MKRHRIILAAAINVGLAVASAKAGVSYSYFIPPSEGFGFPDGSRTLTLYLREVSTPGSFQAPQDGGLYAAGVSIVELAGSAGVTFSASGVSNNNAPEPSGFTGNNLNGLLTSGGAWIEDITSNSATKGVAPVSTSTDAGGNTTNLYLLGSVTVGVSNANANFLVESFHDTPTGDGNPVAGSHGNTLTFNNYYDLDAPGGAPGSTGADPNPTLFIISSPIPEPTSLAVFSLAALGLLRRRRAIAG